LWWRAFWASRWGNICGSGEIEVKREAKNKPGFFEKTWFVFCGLLRKKMEN
jgi:hypothetical protein